MFDLHHKIFQLFISRGEKSQFREWKHRADLRDSTGPNSMRPWALQVCLLKVLPTRGLCRRCPCIPSRLLLPKQGSLCRPPTCRIRTWPEQIRRGKNDLLKLDQYQSQFCYVLFQADAENKFMALVIDKIFFMAFLVVMSVGSASILFNSAF